jgi:hypothetical protein
VSARPQGCIRCQPRINALVASLDRAEARIKRLLAAATAQVALDTAEGEDWRPDRHPFTPPPEKPEPPEKNPQIGRQPASAVPVPNEHGAYSFDEIARAAAANRGEKPEPPKLPLPLGHAYQGCDRPAERCVWPDRCHLPTRDAGNTCGQPRSAHEER